MLINKKIIYRSFIFLSFLFLFFVINSNSVFAADFEINVGSTEWKINSDGIYKNSSKIFCSDIQVGSISDNGFLVKNSSGTKLFLMAEDNIYVSAKDSFASLTYPASISDSFILKKANNDVLLYVDSSGLHYKEGICQAAQCVNDPGPPDCESRSIANCDDGCQIETTCDSSNTDYKSMNSSFCSMCSRTPGQCVYCPNSTTCSQTMPSCSRCAYYRPNQPYQGWICACSLKNCCYVEDNACQLRSDCCTGVCEIDTQECAGDPNPCSSYGDEPSCDAADGCSW